MLTIEQTVTISPDHRIFFDLSSELPVGMAKVELTFTQLADTPQTRNREKIRLTKPMIDEMLHGEDLRFLTGLLHTEMSAEEIRAERLKKKEGNMVWVVRSELREDYKVYIEFNDGISGVIDFYSKLQKDHRQIVRELLDLEKFKTVKIGLDTLCWENGVDFAPEYLYEQVAVQKKVA